MSTFPLQLVHAPGPPREPDAWLIPGGRVERWIGEILAWGVAIEKVRLYVLPRSMADRSAAGVLVTAREAVHPATAIPYSLLAGKLYVPVDARLDPPVTDDELRAKLVWPVAVLHPGIGLVGFEHADVRTVRDLVRPPVVRSARWDLAQPGIRLNERLSSVTLALPPQIEDFLERGREDVATEPPEDLPRTAKERAMSPLRRLGLRLAAGVSGRALRFLQGKGTRAGRSPMMDALMRWASNRRAALDTALQEARFKELLRLIEQFGRDPEDALRHAIPLEGIADTLSPGGSSTKLPNRRPEFNLDSLRRTGHGDAWETPSSYVDALRSLYRSSAARQLQLKRYRRAAYILANLLGDYSGAAAALREGGHYREAAALYRDFAKQPQMAAQCLEEGGLFSEALEAYRRLGMLMKVAEIHERLGETDAARLAYQEHADGLVRRGDFLAAAAVLDTNTGQPDAALRVLKVGYSVSSQATLCLGAAFGILGRLGRHEEARTLIDEIGGRRSDPARAPLLAEGLAMVAANYPDQNLRVEAADATRTFAAQYLPSAPGDVADLLLAAVRKTARHDRLLERDVRRYAAATLGGRGPFREIAARRSSGASRFPLLANARWEAAVASAGQFFLAGRMFDSSQIAVLRGEWNGLQQLETLETDAPDDAAVLMDYCSFRSLPLVLAVAGGAERPVGFTFSASDGMPVAIRVETPPWLPPETLGLCFDESGNLWTVVSRPTHLSIKSYTTAGLVRSADDINLNLDALTGSGTPDDLPGRIQMLVRGDCVALAIGSCVVVRRGGEIKLMRFDHPILSLQGLLRLNHPHLVVTTEADAWLFASADLEDHQRLGQDWVNPVACFTTDAVLVVADLNGARVYGTIEGVAQLRQTLEGCGAKPIAATRAGSKGRFALFTDDGMVHVFDAAGK